MSFPFNLSNNLLSDPQISVPNRQDLLDFQGTNKVQSARYINPNTRDFELNSTNGQFFGQNATDQSVLLALTTTLNSSTVSGLGQNFQSIKTIGPNIIIQITNLLNQILQPLIQSSAITLEDINVRQIGLNSVAISFSYFNLSLSVNTTVSFTTTNGVIV